MPQETFRVSVNPDDQTPKRVRVFGPDNKYYSFPPGTTKDTAVSFFKKRGISSPESVVAPPAKTPAVTAKTEPEKAPEEKVGAFGGGPRAFLRAAGAPETIKDIPHWADFFIHGDVFGPIKEAIKNPSQESIVGAVPMLGPAATEAARHARNHEWVAMLGSLAGAISPFAAAKYMHVHGGIKVAETASKAAGVDSTEAITAANRASTHPVINSLFRQRVIEDAYVDTKGLDVARKIDKAVTEAEKEVKAHAENLTGQIDKKIPTGVVDATDEAAVIRKEFADLVKTPEKGHPVLAQMVKDATSTPQKMWSWEKARQFRSSIGRAIGNVKGPQEAVLTREYISLTKKLGGVAKQYGLEDSWAQYNELEKKLHNTFSSLIDTAQDTQRGAEMGAALSKDTSHTARFLNSISKYGVNPKEVLLYASRANKIAKLRGRGFQTIFRWAYGNPYGAPVMIGARLAGAPWMGGLAAGASVGIVATYLTRVARALRLAPDIVEHILTEEEWPGRRKLPTGKFPDEGAPQLPETTGGGPSPKSGMEGFQTGKGTSAARMIEEPPKQSVEASRSALVTDLRKAAEEGTTVERVEAKRRLAEMGETVAKPKFGTREEVFGKEATKVEPEKHGTGKLAEQAKARERVSKQRAQSKRTKESEAAEAQARAQATHMDVSQLQIPELEEYVRTKNPTGFIGLQKMRKAKGLTDEMYIEGLKYYALEGLEE